MDVFLSIVAFLYALTGIVVIVGYLPTIRDLTRGVASANVQTYFIWSLCGGTAFLYALVVVSDLLLEIMTGLNFTCCLVIFILAWRQKRKGQRKL